VAGKGRWEAFFKWEVGHVGSWQESERWLVGWLAGAPNSYWKPWAPISLLLPLLLDPLLPLVGRGDLGRGGLHTQTHTLTDYGTTVMQWWLAKTLVGRPDDRRCGAVMLSSSSAEGLGLTIEGTFGPNGKGTVMAHCRLARA
jgi:hypothetical protein